MRFSVIVPVYNVEQYLKKCLDSLVNQTFQDFEVLVINDGTKDQSAKIIHEFCNDYNFVKGFIKENGGLSDARNYGIERASGDYLIFVDSDDWVELDLLERLNEIIVQDQNPEIIKYNYCAVNDKTQAKTVQTITPFHRIKGEELYLHYAKEHILFEMAWLYCYQSDYWKAQQFSFAKGYIHEDFELTPRAIMMATQMSSIDYIGYNYLVREGTITRNGSEEKALKSAYDVLHHVDTLLLFSEKIKDQRCKLYFQSYIANAAFDAKKKLNRENQKKYNQEIKQRKLAQYLLEDSLIRRMKKMVYQIKY